MKLKPSEVREFLDRRHPQEDCDCQCLGFGGGKHLQCQEFQDNDSGYCENCGHKEVCHEVIR